jgi:hypothetical protein
MKGWRVDAPCQENIPEMRPGLYSTEFIDVPLVVGRNKTTKSTQLEQSQGAGRSSDRMSIWNETFTLRRVSGSFFLSFFVPISISARVDGWLATTVFFLMALT